MVRVKTTEGLEIILEDEFPCVLNHISGIEVFVDHKDSMSSDDPVQYMSEIVERILYSTEKIIERELLEGWSKSPSKSYDVRESVMEVCERLLDEEVNYHSFVL